MPKAATPFAVEGPSMLALQRLAGNRAVSQLIGERSAPQVQRCGEPGCECAADEAPAAAPTPVQRAGADFQVRGKSPRASADPMSVFFDLDSHTLDAAEAAKVPAIATPPARNLTLKGLVSEEGPAAVNLAVANRRINAVDAALVAVGRQRAAAAISRTPSQPLLRLDTANLLHLQRTAGNAAVTELLTQQSALAMQRADAGTTPPGPTPSPTGTTPPKCSPTPVDVTKIPGVMRANSMPTGAAILDEWFLLPASAAPAFATTDTTTVSMGWVLGFSRAKAVYDSIFTDKAYVNSAAQGFIASLLGTLGVATGGSFDFSAPVDTLDPTYDVQFRAVGSTFDPLDDMKAALGKFTFRVVVGGKVTKVTNTGVLVKLGISAPFKYKVTITDVGVHVRDSFDFNGSQSLGCWNACTNTVGNVSCGGGGMVDNGDFRAWRAANGQGGDIRVLSDVLATHLATPDEFFLP